MLKTGNALFEMGAVVPTFLLFLFCILLMIFFPDQSGFVFSVSLLRSLRTAPVLLVAPLEGVETPWVVGRAVRIPPLPEHLGDGPGRRLASGLSGREPVRDGRKAACCHAAGFYSQFVLFSFPVREQIQSSKHFFPVEHTVQ